MRLDLYLLNQDLAPSRSKAQELVELGFVKVTRRGQVIQKLSSSFKVQPEDLVQVASSPLLQYVSRAGLKLAGALESLPLSVKDFVCLDVGQSTGGFTDCLLQKGARQVIGVDVGHGQLATPLQQHPQVQYYEGVNAKDLQSFCGALTLDPVDLLVMDVSFISALSILSQVTPMIRKGGYGLVLIKPQFELGSQALDKKGLVKEDQDYWGSLKEKVYVKASHSEWAHFKYFPSQVKGKDGNQEFFLFFQKKV